MNKRIKELSDIAYKNHLRNNPHSSFGRRTDYDTKFAELIIRECAKVLTQHGAYFSGNGEPYYYAAHLIEEHFGVEE